MDKLLLIIKREFIAKVKNKSFLVITFLSPLIMVALFAFVAFIQTSSKNEFKKIAYIDHSGLFTKILKNTEHIEYVNFGDIQKKEAKAKAEKENYYGLIYIPDYTNVEDLENTISFYSETSVGISYLSSLEVKLAKEIRILKLKNLNINLDKIEKSKTEVNVLTSKYSGEKSSKIGSMLKMAIGGASGYLIFMFIIIYGNSVMRSVIEEKSNRIIEVIISSVKPFYLMLGKIFGNALAGFLQFSIWIIIGVILLTVLSSFFGIDSTMNNGSNISPEMAEKMMQTTEGSIGLMLQEIYNLPLITIILSFLFYFLGGYLVYSSIYAAIGAAVDSETDTQQFMIPVMMPLMIAIYAGMSIIESPHGNIAVGFSLFPLTSPIVMLMRIPFGVPLWQIIVSMLLLIITFFGIVFVAAKIYRVGILMYGKKPSYKEIYKWLKM